MNWFKRLFCRNQERTIEMVDSNAVVANYLADLVEHGKFEKSYQGIEDFINAHIDVTQPSDLDRVTEVTTEIGKLKSKFKVLKYKFDDHKLRNFIFD